MNNVKSLSENIAKVVSETTKHVELLAAAYPEIRTKLANYCRNFASSTPFVRYGLRIVRNARKGTQTNRVRV